MLMKLMLSIVAWHPEDKKISEIAEDELKHAHELRHAMSMI